MSGQELVRVDDPEHMNLLGLLLKGFLSAQLQAPRIERKARRRRGSFGLQVGTMAVTLTFGPDGVLIHKGLAKRLRARMSGPMNEMIPLVVGGSRIATLIAVLEGRVSVRGNVFALLGLLPILMGGRKPALPALPAASTSAGGSR